MRSFTISAIALMAGVAALPAQQSRTTFRPEFRPIAGILIPTGGLKNDFKSAETFGGQLALEVTPAFHVVSTVAFTHGHNKFVAVENRTNVWQYDAGVELNPFPQIGSGWELRPFLGVGLGARTNDYKATTLKTTTCLAGYGAVGTELQHGMIAFRVEGRDYLTCQESPFNGVKKTSNDIRLNFGIALHLR
jgi:hypothetical protein